jgi:hypothetical protein
MKDLRTSSSFDLVKARTEIPINFVNVIPDRTYTNVSLQLNDNDSPLPKAQRQLERSRLARPFPFDFPGDR